MLNNYLLLAIRHLLKHKVHTALMILGLAVGFAASGIILLINYIEASYDTHWQNVQHIYQLESDIDMKGTAKYSASGAPDLLYTAIKDSAADLGQISRKQDRATRITTAAASAPRQFQEQASLIDNDFFTIFSPQIIQGKLEDFYKDEYSVVIAEGLALKLFGEQPAINKIISLDTTNFKTLYMKPGDNARSLQIKDFKIAAVVRYPAHRNSLGNLQLFAHIQPMEQPPGMLSFSTTQVFLKLKENVDPRTIERSLPALLDARVPLPEFIQQKPSDMFRISFLNITQAHAKFKEHQRQRDNSGILYGLAFTITLMASINFINLSLAAQTRRQKEVALRKVMGAEKKHITQQFMFESLLMTAIAFVLAAALIELSIPWLKAAFALDIDQRALYDPTLLAYLLGAAFIVGLVASSYPSLYLARLSPATTLKSNKSTETKSSIRLRQVLVVSQFVISGILLNSTLVCILQIRHTQAYQPGYQTHHILYATHENFGSKKLQDIYHVKNRIAGLANVEAVSFAMPGLMLIQRREGFRRAGATDDTLVQIGRVNLAASDELQTLNIKPLAGSYFAPEMPQAGATSNNQMQQKVYINTQAMKALGFNSPEEAINQQLELPADPPDSSKQVFTIVAVIGPVHAGRLNTPAEPAIFWPIGAEAMPVSLMIRYRGDSDSIEPAIKKIWDEAMGYTPYLWPIEEAIASEYKDENVLAKFIYLFTGIAIFISCLGLYGLAAHTTARRTKEIGLRKIHGASEFRIVTLLVLQFSRPVVLANIVIWPASFYLMSRWLEKFVDRIDIFWWGPASLLAASLLALLIAWLTVGGHAYKVARARPADSLRDE